MMVENKLKLERMTEACVGMQREKKKKCIQNMAVVRVARWDLFEDGLFQIKYSRTS